jgi:hypothetical protein
MKPASSARFSAYDAGATSERLDRGLRKKHSRAKDRCRAA